MSFIDILNIKKYLKKESDQTVARVGHVNALYNYISENIHPEGKKVYKAILSQSGTGNPTAIVLENTTGVTITFTRSVDGTYSITASSPLFNSSTGISISNPELGTVARVAYTNTTTLSMFTAELLTGNLIDGGLAGTLLTIEIY
jgi:hypothetical protein